MKAPDAKNVKGFDHITYEPLRYDENEMLERSRDYFDWLNKRRSVREFSNKPVPKEIIENIILSASTAPSGAHKQPWTFCAISNASLKSSLRKAAEIEEKLGYEVRMSDRWKEDLAHLGTDMYKPFIENAPWIIVAFKRVYEIDEDGSRHNNYYVNESVGIACGMMISAIHNAGLVTLTHTPSPMNFLAKLLDRPANERAFILFPVGYAEDNAYVPKLDRKSIDQVCHFYE
ncbi:Nitroreductase [Tenacibaculum sp. MAR_2009_124]|uniref:nitroreductase family protein n=1 Tax=Tenacibaculum sp. MAR_2009_124 TaxID=1250059 RepID=UPI0008966D1C|nr:nitroreductase family protein [Tenacibaculum sp. MAR_2009_124]SEB35226.1 Nitroreductase [Tenacibaculum sp. MAR_2009_124]